MRICELRDKEVLMSARQKAGVRSGCRDQYLYRRGGGGYCTGARQDLRVPGHGLRICHTVWLYKENRSGYYTCGNTGGKVFAKNIGVVYNKDSLSGSKRRKPAKQKGGRNYEMSILRKSGYKSD